MVSKSSYDNLMKLGTIADILILGARACSWNTKNPAVFFTLKRYVLVSTTKTHKIVLTPRILDNATIYYKGLIKILNP